jgi:hypothetical protein
MVTMAGGHAKGKAEAPALMIPELSAIFKMTTSTADASPPSETVAAVIPAMTANVPNTTKNMNHIESLLLSKHSKHLNDAASLYDPRAHAAHNGGL